jgi:hypothetical protein
MHSDHHDQDMVYNPKWQAILLAAALVAVSVVAMWAFAG